MISLTNELKPFVGFALQIGDNSKEAASVMYTSFIYDFPIARFKKKDYIPEELIPCGSVEFCLKALGKNIEPDYYPDFLKSYLYRNVWKCSKWPEYPVFIKPASKYKKFTGFVTNGTLEGKRGGPFWCSQIVDFIDEWRYYIADGEVLSSSWYWGKNIEEDEFPDPPKLEVELPEDYCGALDFGLTSDGKFALVEANHPFACGQYDKDAKTYVCWLIRGWKYMLRNYK